MTAKTLTVRAIAEIVGGAVEGDGNVEIHGVAAIDTADAGEITFAADEYRAARLTECKASAAIVGKAAPTHAMPLVRVENVSEALAKLLAHLAPPPEVPPRGVHPSAVVDKDAFVDPSASVGPYAVVAKGAKIAAGCVLCANVCVGADASLGQNTHLAEGVVVKHGCVLGNNVRVGPNSVIGWDGFGYYTQRGVHHLIPHAGNVVVEDDVEMGACVCVDRAKFGSTRIGAGTKIDNLVQIAHGVQVGRGCLIVAQVGIAGSARLGNYVVLGGHAGIRDNVSLGDGVQCSAFAAVASDIGDGEIYAGIPAGPARQQLRIVQATAKLPDLLKQVRDLEARLKALESSNDH
jgi:UDP-3-O-[3-hydroxymyristoyl] glucosamine N-acyltransferase